MWGSQTVRWWFSAIVIASLVISFGLHAVQVDHVHYGVAHDHQHTGYVADHIDEEVPVASVVSLGEDMHMADKKLLLLLATATLFFTHLLTRSIRERQLMAAHLLQHSRRARTGWSCIHAHSYLTPLFRCGLLHPKTY